MNREQSKVDAVATIFYRFLGADHRNEGFILPALLEATSQRNNKTSRTALKRIREWAIADDLFAPCACPANGFTYAVVDDPNMVYDTAMHLWLVASGVKQTEERHRRFIRQHDHQLPRGDREIVKIIDEFEESQRGQQELLHRLIGITVEGRRERRRDAG